MRLHWTISNPMILIIIVAMLGTMQVAFATQHSIVPPYTCGPDCNTVQYSNMQNWNVSIDNVALNNLQPSLAQLANAGDRILQFALLLKGNGHLAIFQAALLEYFQNPQNFYNQAPDAGLAAGVMWQFNGNVTKARMQTELNKVQLGDRQAVVAYINQNGVYNYMLTVASGMSGLANGTFHSPNQAQRIWFDGCIVLGSILLLPVFAGVAAAGAVGGGLVVAGAIGVMILDIYGE